MTLHRRLRETTAAAHLGLEEGLDWQARVDTPAGYRALLARLFGFHAAYEPAIGRALGDDAFWGPRCRSDRAAADLAHLGLSPRAIDALPRPAPIAMPNAAAAMGALYVLEGSTLGGQVIGRHIGERHGLTEAGLDYYRAHGPRTGVMWNAFRARLEGFAGEPETERAVTDAAVATFDAMRVWLCAAPVGAGSDRAA